MASTTKLIPLPLEVWEMSKITLHLYLQIIGKIHMQLHPKMNHWWHVVFYPTAIGLTTGPIPYTDFIFSIDFDFIDHVLAIRTSMGQQEQIALDDLSVADFYQAVLAKLKSLNITVNIYPHPFDPERVGSHIPFADDKQHHAYNKKYVRQFWNILAAIYPVFAEYRGQFNGKSTPVQLYWHSFDMVVTRFSGKAVVLSNEMDPVSREAYSHEDISVGFWPGDANMREPAFYSYTYPEPKNLTKQTLQPEPAHWMKLDTGALAIYKYHDWIKATDLHAALLAFLNSAYEAGAKLMTMT